MRLGVDLGTTWTAAAIHTGDGCEAVQLAEHTIAMPSVVASADGRIVVGEAAERHLATDPTAGVREFKRRLGDSTPYVLAGAPFGAEALMGHLLQHVVATATAQAGEAPQTVTLTHPANWGEFKLDLLREAGRVAGVESVALMSEPEAAARHYANLGRLEPGQAVAVFDFGGGTFDAAVVRHGDDGPELLGTPEGLERLGGIDVDHAVLAHVDAALDGQLRELDTTDPAVRAAVARLRVECTAAKEALSSQHETSIRVTVPGLDTEIRISRDELEQVLRQRMDDMLGALQRAVSSSGLQMEDLSGVLLVGGSSRMPAVAELVSKATGLPAIIDADPKLAVAAGAAWPLEGASPVAARGAEGAGGDESLSSSSSSGARATGPSPTPARSTRSDRLRQAVALTGAVAAAGAVAVGGYFTYRQWWGDDAAAATEAVGETAEGMVSEAEAAELVAGLANEMINEIVAAEADASLDAFDVPGGLPAGGPAFPGPGGMPPGPGFVPRPAGGPDGPSYTPRPSAPHAPPRPSRPAHHDQPDHHDSPMGNHRPPATTRPGDLFSDPELEAVRAQLRERLTKLAVPEGTDPADAAKLRADLDGLLDRFRAYPGQSIDDAVASLRYEFEDRVRDFAQDQRIDAIIEEQKGGETDEPGEMPKEDSPTADKPTTDTPTSETPTPDKPATDTPTTETPTPDKPATDTPTTETPTPDKPGGLADVFDDSPPPPAAGTSGEPPTTPTPPPPTATTGSDPAPTPGVAIGELDPTARLAAPAPAGDPMDDVLGTGIVAEAVAQPGDLPSAPLPAADSTPSTAVAAPDDAPEFKIAIPDNEPADEPVMDHFDAAGDAGMDLDVDPVDDLIDPVGV